MSEEIKLLPCPFCGSQEIEIDETDDGFVGTTYCTKCGVLTLTIEEWNTRSPDVAEAIGEIEEMHGYIEVNIENCKEADNSIALAVKVSYEAINKRLTKIKKLLEVKTND